MPDRGAKVVDLAKARDERSKIHFGGTAICLDCRHEWEAVVPRETDWLECPSCRLVRGRMKFPFEYSHEDFWECACGNDLFVVTRNGSYCPNCGRQHNA